ncbi:bifunctional aminotransferase class I/II-fold pyridoxal phosphate-dependent enzyme/GNAT family N-acetyltransferase [Tunicatimonas pelagia]|uniref:bifunctional aminotransferase class I/II-fold pyridoxal phosphate-dependent enzyme/GNAT family N-acetyltransferase n=1 Tax=Tunicatimonas pelagia TaxID=931531 RepID=UPI002665F3B0|nr:bifunctional aminotransferase class I/II-fold pyridoxal phosphate-dependent enzyme/GNAT family N-acetyltransferase [Tunicatimonas pelagia]WKN44893.1 bifunctional aminotransferase class I/II-fold pyridoxal phosphate-dependent enzyme/GNAT family N-acetyltransferase [Tunicatimonas pelagia]
MAKIHHNNYLDTIAEIFDHAKDRGLMFLTQQDERFRGHHLNISQRPLLNFGTCGYLGLELDQRLIEGTKDFADRYGTQFSVSRAYLNADINLELEALLSEMYQGCPVIVQSSTSTCHISAIPSLVRERDAIILDQSVHMSVQTGCQLAGHRGVPIEMIRHSHLEMLERKINELGQGYEKIWYMIDGVYSMYGDVAPMHDLVELLTKYPQLHLYVDDAHGMGWYGPNGTGYVFGEVGAHEKIILVTTLAKGFGATGGVIVFPDEATYRKVRTFGGPLTYSHPLAPPVIGAATASAHIHLSEEIGALQQELRDNVDYCNERLAATDLPVLSDPKTPIYFIGAGQLRVGHNLVNRMIGEGIYVNLALFPAVPVKCTGLRFTITRHQRLEDIRALVAALAHHYPLALEEEQVSQASIAKAFRLPVISAKKAETGADSKYKIQYETTIQAIVPSLWNERFSDQGSFDWNGLRSLEQAFQGHERAEHNWGFHYFIVRDTSERVVLMTFFTSTVYKDDMLAPASVSRRIEEKRADDPYYLTSRTLAMGSMLTEGNHLYLDRQHPAWRDALKALLEKLSELQDQLQANTLLLRDFDTADTEIKSCLLNEGFVSVDMPNTNVVSDLTWGNSEEFLARLSKNNRRHARKEIFRLEECFEVEIKEQVTDKEAHYFYQLYLEVKRRNYGFNFFDYPQTVVQSLSGQPGWEFLVLRLKPAYDPRLERSPVSVCWCYRTERSYCPMILGMDYNFNEDFKVYKQTLYRVVQRAQHLGIDQVYLGLSADTDKRKVGAIQVPKVAYLQTRDNYHWEVIESMTASQE